MQKKYIKNYDNCKIMLYINYQKNSKIIRKPQKVKKIQEITKKREIITKN